MQYLVLGYVLYYDDFKFHQISFSFVKLQRNSVAEQEIYFKLIRFLTHTVAQFVKYLVIIITFKYINLSICIEIYCKCKKILKVHITYAMFFENIKLGKLPVTQCWIINKYQTLTMLRPFKLLYNFQ